MRERLTWLREDIRADLLRARHRLSKFLLRHGRRFTVTKQPWSNRHEMWLRAQTWPLSALTQTHEAYLRAVEAIARLRTVDAQLQALVKLKPLHGRVQRLRCFRGMDDLTALTIPAELGDARRFPTARGLMAYVGLIPSEHSSGTKARARSPKPAIRISAGSSSEPHGITATIPSLANSCGVGTWTRPTPRSSTRGARSSGSIVATSASPRAANPNSMSSPRSPANLLASSGPP